MDWSFAGCAEALRRWRTMGTGRESTVAQGGAWQQVSATAVEFEQADHIAEPQRTLARVLVVDDHEGIRSLLTRTLVHAGYACVAVADGRSAMAKLNGEAFDLVICDIHLPDLSGLELLKASGNRGPAFVLITGEPSVSSAVRGLQLDAVDYIQKPFKLEQILASVAHTLEVTRERRLLDLVRGRSGELRKFAALLGSIADGESVATSKNEDASESVPESTARAHIFVGPNGEVELSRRECEVVQCIRDGLSTEATAEKLGVSKFTVRNHIARIYKKLGVNSRVALVGLRQRAPDM